MVRVYLMCLMYSVTRTVSNSIVVVYFRLSCDTGMYESCEGYQACSHFGLEVDGKHDWLPTGLA